MKLKHKGFGAVEGLLVVIALTLFIGVGFYVANINKKDKEPVETAQATTNVGKDKSIDTQNSQPDPVIYVQDFYNEYLGTSSSGSQSLIDLAKKYGTQNFV